MKKWFKREKPSFDELEEHACPNCSHVFKGFYCPNCGQSTSEFDRPVGFVFYDFLGNFLAFDSRFVRTFRDLIFKPAFLTQEFFKGRRARYAPPFRVYIFMSFILFLLLQVMTNRGLNTALEYSIAKEWEAASAFDSVVDAKLDSVQIELQQSMGDESSVALNYDDLLKAPNVKQGLNGLASQLEQEAERTEDLAEKKELADVAAMLRSPDQRVAKFLQYLSYAFFVLLPVFALLLSLIYVRHHVFYVRHLIFSVHLHAFIFFLLSVVVLGHLFLSSSVAVFFMWLLLLIPVYSYWSLKKFYGQTYLKTLAKFLLLGFIYHAILVVVLVAVFINALG
ncbi:DUF3667 domain-containing protein [Sunxiuqinia rutila]|uniref:DUF3667 domain-containing protein n=1 Tax=Sunxiuqinia rutila TaxID=1397841 RepID=UPI003D36F5BF